MEEKAFVEMKSEKPNGAMRGSYNKSRTPLANIG